MKKYKFTLSAVLTLSVFILSILLFSSCKSNSDEDSLEDEIAQDTPSLGNIEIEKGTLNDLIQTIPSPIEMATLIKETGGEYDQSLLNATDNSDKYNTPYKQAFNIGVYSADLGYINIYERTLSAMDYISVIKTLSDEINVGQFFDFATLKKLVATNKNADSLLYISINSFNKMDAHLRQQRRGELSVLIVVGAWLEGLHIACQVAKVHPNDEMDERIGEQKIVLDNILAILDLYKKDSHFANLASHFYKLKNIYDGITITYVHAEPETKEINGQLVIVDNSTSKVEMTKHQKNDIIATVGTIRNKLIL
jgi:hypothetical protein